MKTFSVSEPIFGHIWLQLENGHFSCLSQTDGKQRLDNHRKWQWFNGFWKKGATSTTFLSRPSTGFCNRVWEKMSACLVTTVPWRGGSARTTRKKQNQHNSMNALRNLKLPDHLSFLSPLIPLLVDLLTQYEPQKTKKKKLRYTPTSAPKTPVEKESTPLKKECWYHKHGTCRFGNKCYYSHECTPERKTPEKRSVSHPAPRKPPSQPWEMRPQDWNAKVYTLDAFSNQLDNVDNASSLKAIVKIDTEKEVESVKELVEQSSSNNFDLQVLAVQPCHDPAMATANGHEVVFAPVRLSAAQQAPRPKLQKQLS